MSLSPVSIVHVHANRVQLLQASQRVEEHDNHPAALNSFHGTAEHIGRNGLKVLQNAHAESLAQDLVCVLVVGVSDVFRRHEKFNLIDFLLVKLPFLLQLLYLFHALLARACDFQLGLVAPEHTGLSLDSRFVQQHVQVHDLVKTSVADDQEKGPVVGPDAVLN